MWKEGVFSACGRYEKVHGMFFKHHGDDFVAHTKDPLTVVCLDPTPRSGRPGLLEHFVTMT